MSSRSTHIAELFSAMCVDRAKEIQMASRYYRPARDDSNLTDAEVLARADWLIDVFLSFVRVEQPGSDILDIEDLPASRSSLENAFRLAIAMEPRSEFRIQLIKAGLLLARFQPGIGPRLSIRPATDAQSRFAHEPEPEPDEALSEIAKIDKAFANAEADRVRMMELFKGASAIADRRSSAVYPPSPMQPDGTYTWHGHH